MVSKLRPELPESVLSAWIGLPGVMAEAGEGLTAPAAKSWSVSWGLKHLRVRCALPGVMAEAGEGLAAPDAMAAALAYKQSALGSHPAGMADYAFFLENGLGGLPQVPSGLLHLKPGSRVCGPVNQAAFRVCLGTAAEPVLTPCPHCAGVRMAAMDCAGGHRGVRAAGWSMSCG